MGRGKHHNTLSWWKTYDYSTGNTYILAEKFNNKSLAMSYARSCGMIVIPQSTRPITDLERENLVLKAELEMLKSIKK